MKENKKKEIKSICCKHYKGEGFNYILSNDEEINLCKECNLNLASGIMSQIACTTFANDEVVDIIVKNTENDSEDDESNEDNQDEEELK